MLRICLTAALAFGACTKKPAPAPVDAGSFTNFDAGTRADDDGGMVVRFVALGDTGKGTDDQRRAGATVGRVCAAHGCDFVVLLGDNFYPTGVTSTDDPQWQTAFVQPYATVAAPFYGVLGNHDCGGNGTGNELEKAHFQVDYSQVNPKWHMPATHYRFSVRDVDFFVADTNRSMFGLDDKVRADFDTWFAESKAPWRIAFGHHPLKSNGRHGNAGAYDGVPLVPIANGSGVKSFLEEKVCGRADVYVCGHDHVLEWLKPTCGEKLNTELMISGSGSSVTGFSDLNSADHFRAATIGFTYIIIHDRTFTAAYYDGDGNVLFARSFTK